MSKLAKAMQAAAGNAGGAGEYIEDVFSTYLYTGTGAAQTITNGIDLDGEGGLVWIKARSAAYGLLNWDTTMSPYTNLSTYNTDAIIDQTSPYGIASANSEGFSIGNTDWVRLNTSGTTYASWTFRKAPKFFDVVTWTGNGSNRTVTHDLGSVPGMIMVKRTDDTGNWQVYHRANTANPETDYLVLNSTAATADSNTRWNDTLPTDAVFSLGTEATVNASGATYVAYLFAHDAGGFGDDGEQNVISCGSYSGSGSAGNEQDIGFEPQWVLIKASSGTGADTERWVLLDTMRGWNNGGADTDYRLSPNESSAEVVTTGGYPTATGFGFEDGDAGVNGSGKAFIYIAIRRGPMKTPESGTEVFAPVLGRAPNPNYLTGFPVDFAMSEYRINGANWTSSRLQGSNGMDTASTSAEGSDGSTKWDFMDGHYIGGRTTDFISWAFRRAPGFFDVVCWTANVTHPTTMTVNHNLGVAPQMIIKKSRQTNSISHAWRVYHIGLNGGVNPQNAVIVLNSSGAESVVTPDWNNTAPTATQFSAGYVESGYTYVAYLFATVAGVSKVGSYTGTGTTLAIDCGFSAGARFVLIKRTDSTGDWYVWDTARGIASGNDPYLLLNSTAAEVTGTDYIDPSSAGFEISSTAPVAINASGGSYIFLAIA